LDLVSPLGVLKRGYSLTTNEKGRVIKSSDELAVGSLIKTRLAQGSITSRVEEISKK
jgi:exodeoxyribonuclease VII large subunit